MKEQFLEKMNLRGMPMKKGHLKFMGVSDYQ
jgi:hypothetical protein